MKDSDELCNDPSRAIAVDSAYSYTNYFKANRSICCRARSSCGSVHASSSNIVCSGLDGCYGNQLTNDDDGAVICSGGHHPHITSINQLVRILLRRELVPGFEWM
eukprot:446729_1